eukprot:Gb_08072 [translate_table: standard]
MSRGRSAMDSKRSSFPKTATVSIGIFAASLLLLMHRAPSVGARTNTNKDQNPAPANNATADFIKAACNYTLYPDVCVSSLSPYGGSINAHQSKLVQVAVKVSLINATDTSDWAENLERRERMEIGERAALQDCMENFEDALDQLNGSLAELRHLRLKTFKFQISNVQTWLSAALTDQDTCLDGFQDINGEVKGLLLVRVQNICKLISNALALVNRFAATGEHEIGA